MNIITFYSYKGGTGRSLCLANVAAALHLSLGQRIGLIDLDCEAAGLNHLFDVNYRPEADLLNFLQPKNREVSRMEQFVHEVPLTPGVAPGVFMIPTISDPKLLNLVPWDKDIETFLSYDLFPAMEHIYSLDYLLIDARSGLSNYSNYALRAAHLNVLVCRPDRQNRFGISKMIQVCKAAAKPYVIAVSALPNPAKNKGRLEPFYRAIGEEAEFIFPYNPDLYFEEFISTVQSPQSALACEYKKLATTIHNHFKE